MKTIRLAWKALARFRTYTFINILGLALSLACVLIILRYIHQEVTVNHFCQKRKSIVFDLLILRIRHHDSMFSFTLKQNLGFYYLVTA